MRHLLLLAALAIPCSAIPPERSFPEFEAKGEHVTHGFCGTRPYSTEVLLPSNPRSVSANQKKELDDEMAEARSRILETRRQSHRIRGNADRIVRALNECPDYLWSDLDALIAASEEGARDAALDLLSKWVPKGSTLAWTSASTFRNPPKSPAPPVGRYADTCKVPALDDALLAPTGPALPAAAQAKLKVISKDAAEVIAAMRDQKAAVDELVKANGGFRCREIVKAFDDLIIQERGMFFDYREKAVAGAVWDELRWKKP